MEEREREDFIDYLRVNAPAAKAVFMDPRETVFEENVRMNCFYCGKYGHNWRCPPNLPDIDYRKMFSEFDEGAFIYFVFQVVNKEDFESVRNESSIMLHKTLLTLEKWMWNHDRPTALSFGAGSCKLCKSGCGKNRCSNPYMSRSPLEAAGVNVVKTARKAGIQIHFPADRQLMRVGLIMWQNPE